MSERGEGGGEPGHHIRHIPAGGVGFRHIDQLIQAKTTLTRTPKNSLVRGQTAKLLNPRIEMRVNLSLGASTTISKERDTVEMGTRRLNFVGLRCHQR